MYILRDYHDRIDRFICSRTSKAFAAAWVVVALTLASLAVIFFWMGAPPMNGIVTDVPIFLDGAWRILHGQTPHKDFYSIFGDLPYYIALLGMKLGRPGISSIACGNVFVMLGAGLAAMTILSRRTSAFYACSFSLFIIFLAVAPRSLGDPHDFTGYAMIYNRHGEVFLALLGAVLFLPLDAALKKGWADWLEAGFAGLCLPLLLACKLNYFAVGIGFFALACLRGRFTIIQVLFALLSAAGFLVLALMLTGIRIPALLGDYRIMMSAQSSGARLHLLVLQFVKSIVLLPILLLLPWEISRKQDGQHSAWPHFLLLGFIFGSEVLLVATNAQQHELPLLALAALYGAEIIRRQSRLNVEGGFFIVVRNSGAALLFLFFLLPTLATDFKTVRYSVRISREDTVVTPETLRSTRLNDFRFEILGSRREEMKDYMATLNEGMLLLRRHISPQMRLTVWLLSNPYHLALGLPPAEGGIVCFDLIELNHRSHPSLQRMMGNATHILTDHGGEGMKAAFGAEWDTLHLEVVEQTERFALFKVPESIENKR